MPRDTRYAAGTDVPVARTKEEIERLLERYQAKGYGIHTDRAGAAAVIVFRLYGRNIVMRRDLPRADDPAFMQDRAGWERAPKDARAAYEAELRRRWRSILPQLKARLEAVNDEPEATRAETFRRELSLCASAFRLNWKTYYYRPNRRIKLGGNNGRQANALQTRARVYAGKHIQPPRWAAPMPRVFAGAGCC
jgi:hypothetical protein